MKSMGQTIAQGFEKHVIRNGENCWDWKGFQSKNPPYGQFYGDGKLIRAHRASWIIHYGEIPKGMFVCHKCDNPRCTNPSHLFLGTCKDNNIDMMNKKRSPILGKKGKENHWSKLSPEQKNEIKERVLNGQVQREIAKDYNISQTHVSAIAIGRR